MLLLEGPTGWRFLIIAVPLYIRYKESLAVTEKAAPGTLRVFAISGLPLHRIHLNLLGFGNLRLGAERISLG
jgi:hypothetical protein